jgi:hypothetical protein
MELPTCVWIAVTVGAVSAPVITVLEATDAMGKLDNVIATPAYVVAFTCLSWLANAAGVL